MYMSSSFPYHLILLKDENKIQQQVYVEEDNRYIINHVTAVFGTLESKKSIETLIQI